MPLRGGCARSVLPSGRTSPVRGVAALRPWRRRTLGNASGRECGGSLTRAETDAIELAESLAAELRSGASPRAGLATAAAYLPAGALADALVEVVSTEQVGGDVAAALRRCSVKPGLRTLAWLAAAWQVADDHGSRLADAVGLGRGDRTGRRSAHAQAVRAELAGPRSTARLLMLLPLFGLGLGMVLGADPVAVLTGSLLGWGCLAGGAALTLAGWWWTERLARAAVRSDLADAGVLLLRRPADAGSSDVAGAVRAGPRPAPGPAVCGSSPATQVGSGRRCTAAWWRLRRSPRGWCWVDRPDWRQVLVLVGAPPMAPEAGARVVSTRTRASRGRPAGGRRPGGCGAPVRRVTRRCARGRRAGLGRSGR